MVQGQSVSPRQGVSRNSILSPVLLMVAKAPLGPQTLLSSCCDVIEAHFNTLFDFRFFLMASFRVQAILNCVRAQASLVLDAPRPPDPSRSSCDLDELNGYVVDLIPEKCKFPDALRARQCLQFELHYRLNRPLPPTTKLLVFAGASSYFHLTPSLCRDEIGCCCISSSFLH